MMNFDDILRNGWGDYDMAAGDYDDQDDDQDHNNKEDDCSGLEEYRRRMEGRVAIHNIQEAVTANDDAAAGKKDNDDDDDSSFSSDVDLKGGGGKQDSEFHRAQTAFFDSMMYDKDDPRPSDVGIFLTKSQLHKWQCEIAPRFFGQDFKMYENDNDGPHGFGTKLRFRGPGDFPLKFTVLGSKMLGDHPYVEPSYVVCPRGNVHDLCMLNMLQAHDEFIVGWDDGQDDFDENVYDLLPKPPPEPASTRDAKFDIANERYETLMQKQVDWDPNVHGPFEDIFISKMFPTNLVTLAELRNDYTLEYRALILDILLGFSKEKKEAAILENERDSKWLVLEYFSCHDIGGDDDDDDHSVVPGLQVQFGISYERDRAIDFVREPIEDLKFIKCSGRAMNAIQDHVLNTCCGRGLNDVMSGLLLFEGWITPMDSPAPSVIQLFEENQDAAQSSYRRIPERRFGVEFELSCTLHTPHGQLGYQLQHFAGVRARNLHDRALRDPMYLLGMRDDNKYLDEWKIDRDGSIEGSPDYPNSSNFELISPILKGEAGVNECKNVLNVMNDVTALLLNKSMGVHVHIEVVRPSLETLKSISINFLHFEDAIDSFMAESRRTGANKYCRSNLRGLMKANKLNSKQEAIASVQKCQRLEELYDLVNTKGRYHKMNLQNLKTGKRPTIEFRQHSATSDPRLVEPWIRLCMALVYNSIRFGPLDDKGQDAAGTGETELLFDDLFDLLIQDPELKKFYRLRREELQTADYVSEVFLGPASYRTLSAGQKLGSN